MLNPKSSRMGNFDFSTRLLEECEKKYYGIFISHANDDNEYLYSLRDAMLEKNLYPLCDRDILAGGDDFQAKIESALDCYAAVIIITPASLRSNWVNYEMGILSGKRIPIFLWDPEDVLNRENPNGKIGLADFADAHLNEHLPAHTDMNSLIGELCDLSRYSEMFCEENAFLDCKTFRDRMNKYATTVIATIESDLFDQYYSYFTECRIGTLIPNFGMFYPNHGDGVNCFAHGTYVPLQNGRCPQSGMACALSPTRALSEENKECVLLNHIMYNGRILRAGEADRRGVKMNKGALVFHLPVHRLYGTEFKFIIDVPDNSKYDAIISVLEMAGMNPSSSGSMFGGRIYLSLPERRGQGLFRLDHQFTNNFLCPHATRKGSF